MTEQEIPPLLSNEEVTEITGNSAFGYPIRLEVKLKVQRDADVKFYEQALAEKDKELKDARMQIDIYVRGLIKRAKKDWFELSDGEKSFLDILCKNTFAIDKAVAQAEREGYEQGYSDGQEAMSNAN